MGANRIRPAASIVASARCVATACAAAATTLRGRPLRVGPAGGVGAGGVRPGAQAGGECGGPAGHGLAVVVGEADDRGPRRGHAGVASGGGAAAGPAHQSGPRSAGHDGRDGGGVARGVVDDDDLQARARSGARARRGRWRGGRGGRGSARPPRPGDTSRSAHRNTPQPATATAPASDAAGSRHPVQPGSCQYPDPGRDGRSGEHGGRRADRSPCGHGRYRHDREGDGARRRGRQGRPGAQPQRRSLQRERDQWGEDHGRQRRRERRGRVDVGGPEDDGHHQVDGEHAEHRGRQHDGEQGSGEPA